MKRILLLLALIAITLSASSQNVFKLVHSKEGIPYVNVRKAPSRKARKIGEIMPFMYGFGNAMVLGYSGKWTKVLCDGKVGYAYSPYLEEQCWYSKDAKEWIVAVRKTKIYRSDSGEDPNGYVFQVVEPGTIIMSNGTCYEGRYCISGAHDHLYFKKKDVKVVRRK